MNLFDMLPGEQPAEVPDDQHQDGQEVQDNQPKEVICSRKGCREAATTQLLWNNPKIHTADRRKIWLACDIHVAWLEDYLQSRSLWKETLPMTPKDPV